MMLKIIIFTTLEVKRNEVRFQLAVRNLARNIKVKTEFVFPLVL